MSLARVPAPPAVSLDLAHATSACPIRAATLIRRAMARRESRGDGSRAMTRIRSNRSSGPHAAQSPTDAMRVRHVLAIVVVVMATLAGCQGEERDFEATPSGATATRSLRMSDVVPGAVETRPHVDNPYEDSAYDVSEGRRLYHWFNCSGCHAEGGGGSGPALMDNAWIYGSDAANVFATIVQGRPNGMPAFGGRIPENEVWQLVAYVRSMSGLVSKQAAPNRPDALHAKKPEGEVDRQPPLDVSTPRP
jgi:cytochrome c oxidase cbb3-type subunit 3